MADPIITEADRAAACRAMDTTDSMALDLHRIDVLALALAQARAEGRLEGMEEAARIADELAYIEDGDEIGDIIRARTTKEG